jgi:hypothetical protein
LTPKKLLVIGPKSNTDEPIQSDLVSVQSEVIRTQVDCGGTSPDKNFYVYQRFRV